MIPKHLKKASLKVGLTLSAGVKVYRKFYTEEKEKSYGVLAISVSKPTAQPYITMTDILAVSASLQNFVQNFFHVSYCKNIFFMVFMKKLVSCLIHRHCGRTFLR